MILLANKLIIQFRNHIKTEGKQSVHLNVHCAKNNICIKGKESSITVLGEGYLRSSRCYIEGNNNVVKINDKTYLSSNSSIRIIGNNNTIEIGGKCAITNCSFYILGNNNVIKLDDNVSAILTSVTIERNNNKLNIGNNTSIHGRTNGITDFSLDESSSITIKEDCMISNGVSFRSSDQHSVLNSEQERINPAKNVLIDNHVWVCMRACILKGTIIHSNSIVGAGSICNKDYEKGNCMIVGNPARIVREKVDWSRDRI